MDNDIEYEYRDVTVVPEVDVLQPVIEIEEADIRAGLVSAISAARYRARSFDKPAGITDTEYEI